MQMSENFDRLTNCRKFVVARKRNKNFVADSADIDHRLRRQRMRESAMEKSDHVQSLTARRTSAKQLFAPVIPSGSERSL